MRWPGFPEVRSTLAMLLVPAFAWAWNPDGTIVCQTGPNGQQQPLICADGAGGVFIAWTDFRLSSLTSDVYTHHLTSSGARAIGWPVNGLPVFALPSNQFASAMTPDGQGGVLIGAGDFSNSSYDPLVQRLTAAGAVSPGWPAGGVNLDPSPINSVSTSMAPDGAGGAYVAWDRRSATIYHAFLQHLLASGEIAPGWPSEGRRLSPLAAGAVAPVVLADGVGGAVVAWTQQPDANVLSGWLMLQHFASDGSIMSGWPAEGAVLCSAPGGRHVSGLVQDGNDGWFAVWEDNRIDNNSNAYYDVYAQHCLADGTIESAWPADGLAICSAPGTQWDSRACSDGAGGFFAAWEDYRPGVAKIYGVRFNSAGQRAPNWPENGMALAAQSDYQLNPRIVPDAGGGFYALWLNYTGDYRAYVQHFTANGTVAVGWAANGTPVTTLPGTHQSAELVGDDVGGAFVTWDHSSDIYAQRYGGDGPVPAMASLASVEATPTSVALRWHAQDFAGGGAGIYRRDALHDWTLLGSADREGVDYLVFTDRSVTAGSRYAYRLGLGPIGAEAFTAETWVDVPDRLSLALGGLRPNPATHPLRVSFTLPNDSPARLEVVDVAGRQVFEREVGSLGAGSHLMGIESEGRLESGMYWIRLEQQGRTLVTRGAVLN